MRYIGVDDTNGTQIFEGDTVEFSNPNVFLIKECIAFLNIDRVTAYVVPQHGRIGSVISFRFYSKRKEVYTYKNKYQFLLTLHKDDPEKIKQTHEWFNNLTVDTDSVIETLVASDNNFVNYAHEFKHSDKTIIKSEADKTNPDTDNVFISYSDKRFSTKQAFLVEVNEEVKERLLKHHELLYDNTHGYEGEFTHLKLIPKIYSDMNHRFKAIPVNKDMELTFKTRFDSSDAKMEERVRVTRPMRKELDKWTEENENVMDKNAFESELAVKTAAYKAKIKEISEREFIVAETITDFFIGFCNSSDLLQSFYDDGCKIETI